MAKRPYKVVQIAKEYLSKGLDPSSSSADVDEQAILRMITMDESLVHPNERSSHNGALHLLSGAVLAVAARDRAISYQTVAQEIDRRADLLTEGWVKDGLNWHKGFSSPSELMDFMRVMKKSGFRVTPLRPITDDSTQLVLNDQSHQRLHMLLEGRSMEIE